MMRLLFSLGVVVPNPTPKGDAFPPVRDSHSGVRIDNKRIGFLLMDLVRREGHLGRWFSAGIIRLETIWQLMWKVVQSNELFDHKTRTGANIFDEKIDLQFSGSSNPTNNVSRLSIFMGSDYEPWSFKLVPVYIRTPSQNGDCEGSAGYNQGNPLWRIPSLFRLVSGLGLVGVCGWTIKDYHG